VEPKKRKIQIMKRIKLSATLETNYFAKKVDT